MPDFRVILNINGEIFAVSGFLDAFTKSSVNTTTSSSHYSSFQSSSNSSKVTYITITMYQSLSILTGLLAVTSFGAPVQKRDVEAPPGGDIAILNYALALEYLERKFYEEGTTKFTEEQFCAEGFDGDFYKNLWNIYEDEKVCSYCP